MLHGACWTDPSPNPLVNTTTLFSAGLEMFLKNTADLSSVGQQDADMTLAPHQMTRTFLFLPLLTFIVVQELCLVHSYNQYMQGLQ